MMLPTHAIAGLAIATPLLVFAPDHAAVALAGGLVGGALPDLDRPVRRRPRTPPVGGHVRTRRVRLTSRTATGSDARLAHRFRYLCDDSRISASLSSLLSRQSVLGNAT